MKNNSHCITIEILQENRKTLSEKIAVIDQMITDYTNGKINEGNKQAELALFENIKPNGQNIEADEKGILNIFRLAERPLTTTEIKNYLGNNLGIDFPNIITALNTLKRKNMLAHLRLNNAAKLSFWVMDEWVDWHTAQLKRPYKKFGITKNYAIRSIDFF